MTPETLALKIRSAIATKEWYTAAANGDIANYGAWREDYRERINETEAEIERLFKEFEEPGLDEIIQQGIDEKEAEGVLS